MEAANQGTAMVGVVSKRFVVIAALLRCVSKLAEPIQKLYVVDSHICVGISGLIADARILTKYMRDEALNHRYVYESAIPLSRLAVKMSSKNHYYTQNAERRPFGAGFLIGGVDITGTHLFETSPSGNHFEYIAHAMGSRSQPAKTYLEKNFESFSTLSLDELIGHAVRSLVDCTGDTPFSKDTVAIAHIGIDSPVTILSPDQIAPYIDRVHIDIPEMKQADALEEKEVKEPEPINYD